jgi:hypothetical protein
VHLTNHGACEVYGIFPPFHCVTTDYDWFDRRETVPGILGNTGQSVSVRGTGTYVVEGSRSTSSPARVLRQVEVPQ